MASAFKNGEKLIANSTVGESGGDGQAPLSPESNSSPSSMSRVVGLAPAGRRRADGGNFEHAATTADRHRDLLAAVPQARKLSYQVALALPGLACTTPWMYLSEDQHRRPRV